MSWFLCCVGASTVEMLSSGLDACSPFRSRVMVPRSTDLNGAVSAKVEILGLPSQFDKVRNVLYFCICQALSPAV